MRRAEDSRSRRRALRQDDMRRKLSEGSHLRDVTSLLDRIRNDRDPVSEDQLTRYKVVLDYKFKLLNKFLPDLRATEITGEGGEALSFPTLTVRETKALFKELDDEC